MRATKEQAKESIMRALREAQYSRVGAAELLGVSRATLYRAMRDLDLLTLPLPGKRRTVKTE